MIIGSKFNGYSRDNRRLYYMDGGGGGSAPATQTQVSDLPDWAKPYAKETLGKAQALTDIEKNPYQAYKGERTAGFTPMQEQSFRSAAGMQPSQLGAQAGQMAGAATMGALGTTYDPYQMGQFTAGRAAQYMNPFVEMAMEPQLREAQRTSEMQRVADMGAATRAGAFGGGRQAIVEAERQRNLGTQLGDIRARGLMSAFEQAQQQFAREQQMREQSRQYGAGLGMQGLQTALQGAGQMGALGGQQFQQGMDINKLQNLYGQQQQQLEQQRLSQSYQDFMNQQRYPYQQLEFMSNILRGTPMGTVQTLYGGQPNTLGTLAGLGAGIAGTVMGRAEGGMVNSYAEGGVTDTANVESILSKLSDQQLQQANEAAMARGDTAQMQMIAAEMAQRASMRRGVAAGIPDDFAADMEEGMAAGGIVAFAEGGVSPEFGGADDGSMALDELRRQRVIQERKAAEEAQRMEFLRTAAPEVAARLEAQKPATRTAAPTPAKAPAPAAKVGEPKPPVKEVKEVKEVRQAAKEVASNAGVPERSMADEAMALYRQMQDLKKEDVKELRSIVEGQKGRAEELRGRGIADALRTAGFAMAEKASRPGATFVGSLGAAAPTFAATLSENEKAVRAAQENFAKMQADQAKYEIALDKGDLQAAQAFAANIRRDTMEQKKLDQLIKYQNRALSIQAAQAGRSPDLIKIANDIMADPSFKGSRMDALKLASGLQGGTEIRTDFNRQKLFADKLEKDTSLKLLNLELSQAKTDADRAKIQAKINERRAAIAQDVNREAGGTSAAPATVMRFDAKGNPIQ